MLSHYQMKEIPYLRILGRTNGSLEPVTLFWTASGIELNVKATEIWVKIRSDYDVFEPWVDVIVDGVLSQRLMVNKGEQEICLFRNTLNSIFIGFSKVFPLFKILLWLSL